MPLGLSVSEGAGRLSPAVSGLTSGGVNRLLGAAQDAITSLYGGTVPGLSSAVTQAAEIEGTQAAKTEWLLCTPDGSAIPFDTVYRIDVDSANQTMQSPTEMGSFIMYNKVVTPTTIDVEADFTGHYAGAGAAAERQRVTKLLLDLSCTNDLVTLITPEMEFSGYNIETVSYSRNPDDGTDRIIFHISLIEVRQVSAQYGNAKLAPKTSKGKQNGPQSALSGIGDYLGF